MAESFDLIIIGSGPGGYTTAARAAADGRRVAIVERDHLGGTCLNRGCIPTKVMCHGAEAGEAFAAIAARRADVIGQLREAVATVLAGVTVIQGNAIFVDAHTLAVEGSDEILITAPEIIIATGSAPAALPIPGASLAMSSDDLLALDELPASLAIVGGGVIGMEFASALNALGVKVTVIEYCPEILPAVDAEVAKRLRMTLKRRGIDIHTGAAVTALTESEAGVTVAFTVKGREKSVEAAVALMAVGRKAVVPQGAVEAGVTLDRRGFIVTDDRFMTSAEGVYAIGDVNGKCLLAHAAEAQGHRVLGLPVNLDVIPAVCFTSPAVATVGLTAAQAREKGYEPRESSATFRSNGYALAIGEPDGMVKMVTDVTTGRMLGCHICGPHAADLIAEPALAIAHGLTAADIASTVHAHPTLCETVARAAAH